MKSLIFKTSNNYAALLSRLFVALVLFPHGAQKLFGWFGGFGFSGTMQYFTDTQHLPWLIGFTVIIVEVLGPIALIAGFATRFWSIAISIVMAGVAITNFSSYFFMNWLGAHATEGYEFFLAVIGMAASLVVSGGGALSADRLIYNKQVTA